MDAASPTKEKVTLLGFLPKFDGHTLKHKPKATNVTITVNGVPLPRDPDPLAGSEEKVTLVRFSRSESFNEKSSTPSPGMSSSVGGTRSAQERQERLSRLTEETREWFSKMGQQDEPCRADTYVGNSPRMQEFFDEAQDKFAKCSHELFAEFVRKNQDRFSQMLEFSDLLDSNSSPRLRRECGSGFSQSNGKAPNSYQPPRTFAKSPTGAGGCPSECDRNSTTTNDSGIHSGPSSPNSGDSSGRKFPHSSSATSSSSSNMFNANNFSSTFANPPFFESTQCANGYPFANGVPTFKNSRRFGSFPTFPSFPSFPTSSPNRSPQLGRGGESYHTSSSKSTFEYCGNTNTYRFSTEQMSHSYEQSFDTMSESDDEDDDDDEEEEVIEPLDEASEDGDSQQDTSSFKRRSVPKSPLAIEPENKLEKLNNILFKIASELLTTERTYVGVLHLIDQVFQFRVDNENRAHNMFPQEVITQMFSNIKSIYKLHNDFFLPQLEQRMMIWERDRRIGDIMKNFAPFLKMYTEYVKNFDNAMNIINLWALKQPRFNSIIEEIHRMPECKQLTLQHHMLVPIQRVPRYELLLKDYLKKLPEDSPDQEDTEKALHLVSTAANHSNDAMKKIDKFKKLLEIQDMIGGAVDLVSPTRELVREGKIIKISARSGDHQERQLFLFNDLLLLCSQRLISNRVVSGPSFRVRAKLDIETLQILEGDNLETANTFYIRNTQKTIELYTHTTEEKEKWLQALFRVIQDLYKRKSSLKIGAETFSVQDSELGRRAPLFLKLDSTSTCMSCSSQFSAFKRRHHCRACGRVVCHKCSVNKLPLVYDENKSNRVCNDCYIMLAAQLDDKLEMEEKAQDLVESPTQRRGVLEVKAEDDSVISGFLHLKARGKTWIKRWFALHTDFVLYSFKGSEDQQAMTSTPLPGLTVAQIEKCDGIDRENVFKLFHKKKIYYFQARDSTDMIRWVAVLEKASRAELPV